MTIRRLCGNGRAATMAAAIALLAACGGGLGELILLTIVTPLNGTWRLDGDVGKEGLQFISPFAQDHLFDSTYDVTAVMLNPADRCGAPDDGNDLQLVGSFDNGKVVLRAKDAPNQPVCVEGSFASLIRFDAAAVGARPAGFYENNRVDVQLGLGLWVDEGATVTLKFGGLQRDGGGGDPGSIDNDEKAVSLRACDSSPGVTKPVLEGKMDGYVKAVGASPAERPTIPTLSVVGEATVRYTDVEFVDGATLTLKDAGGQTITLKRRKETTPTVCA